MYIPFSWQEDFSQEELAQIRYCCLIMSKEYIQEHFTDIQNYASIIENRQYDEINKEQLIQENQKNLTECQKYQYPHILITDSYPADIPL